MFRFVAYDVCANSVFWVVVVVVVADAPADLAEADADKEIFF